MIKKLVEYWKMGVFILVTITAGVTWFTTTNAYMSDVNIVMAMVSDHKKQSYIDDLNRRLWQLRDHFNCITEQECAVAIPRITYQEYEDIKHKLKKLMSDKYELRKK